jgi:CRP/FNR family cyclic AMP-dependent transcriptional regulator
VRHPIAREVKEQAERQRPEPRAEERSADRTRRNVEGDDQTATLARRAALVRNGRGHDTQDLMESSPRRQPRRLLLGAAPLESDDAEEILADCPVFDVGAGEPHFRASFPGVELLAVEQGFIVVRSTPEGLARSIVTCEAGPGRVLLRPAAEEVLFGLVPSRLIEIDREARDRLLEHPGAARRLLELIASTLSQKQEALGNFAHTRHIERVRRKLLQLAESYGRVVQDGIRIDFPVSHSLLADMIGSSRETVTRALDELQRTGFVARRGHTYRLLVSPERVLEPM